MKWSDFKKKVEDYLLLQGCDKETTEITFFVELPRAFNKLPASALNSVPLTFKDAEIVDGVFVYLKEDK